MSFGISPPTDPSSICTQVTEVIHLELAWLLKESDKARLVNIRVYKTLFFPEIQITEMLLTILLEIKCTPLLTTALHSVSLPST